MKNTTTTDTQTDEARKAAALAHVRRLMEMDGRDLGNMVAAYTTAAQWTTPDDDDNDAQGVDVSPKWSERARNDCSGFYILAKVTALDFSAWDDAQLGHDFWLTRNGHGVGFWDRPELDKGTGVGDQLTAIAVSFGALDAYICDTGLFTC